MQRLRSLLSVVATILLEVGGLAAVVDMGAARWATIGWRDPALWMSTSAPTDVLAATLRVVAIAGLAWLLVATVLQIALTAHPGTHGGAVRIPGLPTSLRRRIDAAVAALVATTTLAAPTAAVAAPGLPDHIPVPIPHEVVASHDQAPPAAPPAPPPAPPPARPPAPAVADPADRSTAVHTVARGDHLWGIAERHLRDRDPAATVGDVATYWRALVAANQALPSGDPDLIHPGEQVVLPPL